MAYHLCGGRLHAGRITQFPLTPQIIMTDHHNRDSLPEACYQATFDPQTDSVSEELIDAVATLKDADPTELPVLADYIDPDALNTLFQPREDGKPRDTDGCVHFEFDAYIIRIQTVGTMTLHQPSPAPED